MPRCTFMQAVPMVKGPGAGPRTFVQLDPTERNQVITGTSRDSSGAALAGVTVKLFNSATDVCEQRAVSDAAGGYSFAVDRTQTYYLVEYKAGSPDVAGTSLNTLTGA